MKVTYISLDSKFEHEKCVCTVGNFDALHFGHKVLIQDALRKGKSLNLPVSLITFDQDPLSVITNKEIKVITPLEYRIKLCEDMALDEVIVLKFDHNMADLEPLDFIERILKPLNIAELICGYDFSFGKNALGNPELLSKYIKTNVVEEIVYFEERISTTYIKRLLETGDLDFANTLLKRKFSIMGNVIYGNQVGRTINYPTANIGYFENQFLPKLGVYIGKLEIDGIDYPAMINIGRNPTFYDDYHLSLEVHILDFDENIYGKTVICKFYKFLRDEIKFSSVDQLITQLNIDKDKVKQYFS